MVGSAADNHVTPSRDGRVSATRAYEGMVDFSYVHFFALVAMSL